jgi:hypothetical protein
MSWRDHESSIGRGEYGPGRILGPRVLALVSVLTAAIGVLAIAGPARSVVRSEPGEKARAEFVVRAAPSDALGLGSV